MTHAVDCDALLLALGGASWPRLGSDAAWVEILRGCGVAIAPLRPANCGFITDWPDIFADKYAGQPLKPVALSFAGQSVRGEAMITRTGIEGGVVYALSSALRTAIEAEGRTVVMVDLRPDMDVATLTRKLAVSRGRDSISNFLRKRGGLSPVAAALVRVVDAACAGRDPAALAGLVKALPLTLTGTADMARAISSAGGIARDALDDGLMLKDRPGVFVAGEMIDWEAPTGGYLLQATYATGIRAARGIAAFIAARRG